MPTNVAQSYLQARAQLLRRLDELEAEMREIRDAVASTIPATGPKPAGKPGRKPGPKPKANKPAMKRRPRGQGVLAILKAISEKGPVKPAQIAKDSGVNYGTVSTALTNLRKKKHVVRSDKGWALTPAGKAELDKRSKAG